MRAARAGRHGARHRVPPRPGGAGAGVRGAGLRISARRRSRRRLRRQAGECRGGRAHPGSDRHPACSSAAASATWRRVEGWLDKGVTRVIIGTAAVRDPALVARSGDALSRPRRGRRSMPATARSRSRAGPRRSELTALDVARRFEDAGVAAIIYTDIARDGMLKGLNLDATIALAEAVSHPGHRLGRARVDRGRAGAACSRARASSPAPSPAARSTTAGSMRPRRSRSIRAQRAAA